MITNHFPEREFLLINNDNGTKITMGGDNHENPPVPKNYKEVESLLKRSLENNGVVTEISSEYEFVKQSASFLRGAYEGKDIEANVDLIEYRFNPDTDVKYLYNTSNADFSTIISNENSVLLKFKSSGLNSIIKSKRKERFALDRKEDIEGNKIDDLKKETISLVSRNIELNSQLETKEEDSLTQSFRMRFGGFNYREGHVGIPLSVNYESDDKVFSQVRDAFTGSLTEGLGSMVFYANSDSLKELNVKFDLEFTPFYRNIIHLSTNNTFFKVVLETYNNGASLDIVASKRRVLFEVLGDSNVVSYFFNSQKTSISFDEKIVLEQGESLSLQWYGASNFGGTFQAGRFDVDFGYVSCLMDIQEESVKSNTQTQVVLMKDVGEKLAQILTGKKNKYISDFFTNGDFKLCGITLGLWLRQIYDSSLEISFDQFIKNSNSLFSMGYTIDKINGEEHIIHEKLDYFFQDFVSIEIEEQVVDVVRSPLIEQTFSSIKVGYKKPSGDNLYEEVEGLDEPNILNNYSTPITKVEKVYDAVSDFRADSYGKQFAVNQSIEKNPNGDTRYDKGVFLLDLKETSGEFLQERIWSDDFETLPLGVFSPKTITGLRFSPMNNLLRHGKVLRSFLSKFVDKKIRFSNSKGNSSLITHPVGGVERAESSDVLINDLAPAIFLNQSVEFNFKTSFKLHEQVYGRTLVNGRSVPNFFGKVRFTNERGEKEEGYFLELSFGKEGKCKLIKKA